MGSFLNGFSFLFCALLCSQAPMLRAPAPAFAADGCRTFDCSEAKRARLSHRDGLEAFGAFAAPVNSPEAVTPSATPTPAPSRTPAPTPTPRPTPPPVATPRPSGGGGLSDLGFLDALLGGAVSNALGGLGLPGLGGGGGPGGGGLLGGGSQGWGDGFGGTSSDAAKYGQQIDFSQELIKQVQSEDEQFPGEPERCVEGGKCRTGPGYFSDKPQEGALLGPGDKVAEALGSGGQFGNGAGKTLARQTGAQYQSFSKGSAGSQEILGLMRQAGRGDMKNPITGERQNVVVIFNCHGGGDYLEATGGGVTGAQMAQAALAGGKETGNTDFSHITLLDGGCMPCRGNVMKNMFDDQGAEKSINYFSGAAPNKYAWGSYGAPHVLQQLLGVLSNNGGARFLTKGNFIQAVKAVGNGAYFHRGFLSPPRQQRQDAR